ncbi:fasciclin domain-containing protein [Lewinella sp. 4G2]|uniref:fasciclin domain-containing protein n=1 Tax=Lewinella sp. 4G2 TaxID=1803372 RepID=UPI0007B48245|nr:fasciclin domain-containing protein [Lewinella sp. 4G2]OAV43457.1 hypothetical protein A3850_002630 [Lewinella sp. 4G2]
MLKLTRSYQLLLLAIFVLGFTSCDDDEDRPNNPVIGTIADIVESNGDFTSLAIALERTGLDATLDVANANVTVFAPNDAAFTAAGVDASSVDVDALRNILLYHVISGDVQAAEFADGEFTVNSLNTTGAGGSALPIFANNAGGSITVGGAADNSATVVTADVQAVNGTIHIIDDVLMPPSIVDRAVRDGRFNTLVAAVTRAGLAGVLSGAGTFTVFAPTDDAFADAGIDLDDLSDEDLGNILKYHVLGATVPSSAIAAGASFPSSINTTGPDGAALSLLVNNTTDGITINGNSNVVVADVSGNNGVVHAIDQVLMPQSIVDFVVNAPGLDSLAGAVVAAGLVETLSSDGPFTVFAPTNDAFAAIDSTVATLSVQQLSSVLTYHVVGGANVRSDALPAMATTVQGEDLNFSGATITTSSGQEVAISATDIQGTNGVVHLVPTVLLPTNL